MRLGVDFPQEWKLHSEKNGIALSDILYGYVIETLMIRISKSTFYEVSRKEHRHGRAHHHRR